MKRWFAAPVFAWLAVAVPGLQAQMMGGGGREVRAGREVMNERLASASAGQRAWLEALRDERAGSRTVSQRLGLRVGTRHYTLASADVSETFAQVAYSLRRPGMKLRVVGGPVRFTTGDTVTIGGISPLDLRLDLSLSARDSLRIAVRAPSSPMTLSGAQVAALATVATATVDLASVELGTQASASAAYARTHPIGTSASVSGALGVDLEPRPTSARWSYWRGVTLRGGARLSGSAGRSQITAAVEVTRSFADSLGGRNLFPGGGTLLTRAGIATDLGAASSVVLDVSTFWFRPFASAPSGVANTRTPLTDFVGASAILVWPLQGLLVTPVLVVTRESGDEAVGAASTRGSGWAVASSVAVDVPLGLRFGLTPEVGYAGGSLRSEVGSGGGTLPRASVTQSLSGWWLATDLSLSF